jgi:hypothetical protein
MLSSRLFLGYYCHLNHGNGDGDQAKLLLSLSGLPLSSQASRSRFSSEWRLNGNTVSWDQPMLHFLRQTQKITFAPMGSLLRDSRTLEWDNIAYDGSGRDTYGQAL